MNKHLNKNKPQPSPYVEMNKEVGKVSEKMFETFPTHKPIDKILSDDGGFMRATVVMVIGDPGVGKTTMTNDILADIKKLYPTVKMLFISSEETKNDRAYSLRKSPKIGDTPTLFLGEQKNKQIAIDKAFNDGFEIILIDSLKDTQDKIQAESDLNIKEAEQWLLDRMVAAKDKPPYPLFICIQQVTKGKAFVGSNAIKHNTTAMLEIRFDEKDSNKRYASFSKNRRCGKYVGWRVYYKMNEKTGELLYDEPLMITPLKKEKAEKKEKVYKAKVLVLRPDQEGNHGFAEMDKKWNEGLAS